MAREWQAYRHYLKEAEKRKLRDWYGLRGPNNFTHPMICLSGSGPVKIELGEINPDYLQCHPGRADSPSPTLVYQQLRLEAYINDKDEWRHLLSYHGAKWILEIADYTHIAAVLSRQTDLSTLPDFLTGEVPTELREVHENGASDATNP